MIVRLDISSLHNAVLQLEQGIEFAEAEPAKEIVRDGVIQRFEYCYELAQKMIKRTLETQFDEKVDTMAWNDVLRTAAERGLITNIERWFDYRTERNKTSHTYDASVAMTVYASAKKFLPDVQQLLSALEKFSH
ncbi:MAG: nucleotidyltransferase substrate binding protein [Candidatus Peribacteraceae bacterium]|nr:nucleotidyltransferase substrate binding protein [Candidatus Peribacteraceae bacterium]